MELSTLKVKGMSCGHCVKAIEDNVGQLDGVEKVSVDLDAGTVQVSHNQARADLEKIQEAIEDQGYDVIH